MKTYFVQGCGNAIAECPTCPISLKTSKKFQIYLSWDKDLIAESKKNFQIMRYIFSYFSKKI